MPLRWVKLNRRKKQMQVESMVKKVVDRNCRICLMTKPLEQFYERNYKGKISYRTECKDCIREKTKNYFRSNYHHNLEKKRIAYRYNHKFKNIKDQYGLTKDEYFEILDKTNGLCPICNRKINKPNVDHCHNTGVIRGIICFQCNLGMGNFNDDIERLKNAIKYLERSVSGITLKSAQNKGDKNAIKSETTNSSLAK